MKAASGDHWFEQRLVFGFMDLLQRLAILQLSSPTHVMCDWT